MIFLPLPALIQTPPPAQAPAEAPVPPVQFLSEAQKIESLIQSIEKLQGQAIFIRNGSEHDARAAGDHLRLKLRNAGKRVKTAGDFIRGCATKSSFSGKPYRIRYQDGHEISSSDFFWTELKKIDPTIK